MAGHFLVIAENGPRTSLRLAQRSVSVSCQNTFCAKSSPELFSSAPGQRCGCQEMLKRFFDKFSGSCLLAIINRTKLSLKQISEKTRCVCNFCR